MTQKFNNRFSPSIIRAADAAEAALASARVEFGTELFSSAQKVFEASVDNYNRHIKGVSMLSGNAHRDVVDLINLRKAERKIMAEDRRAKREARELERQGEMMQFV